MCREALDGPPPPSCSPSPPSDYRRSLASSDVRGDVHALVRAHNNSRRMCAVRCVSLFMLAAVAAMFLSLFVCLRLDISGGGGGLKYARSQQR